MKTGHEDEFYMMLSIYGGIILSGFLIVIVLGAFAMMVRAKMKKENIIKELYEKSQRKNGQSKGGAKGHY